MDSRAQRIYFDHAATTAVRPEVQETVSDILLNHYGNPSSFYREGHDAAQLLQKSRETVAEAIGANANEICFTSCGSESDNWAIKGTAFALKEKKGKHLISSRIEHHAVLHSMEWLEQEGFDVTYLDVDANGLISPEDLEKAIRPDTILVSIMMANNEVGTIQDIARFGEICQEKKVLFHSDAVQALGAVPIDVEELKVDMMSFSGHKLYAPKGVGALYLRRTARIDNLLHGGAQERGRRAGTENLALIAAFARALELAVREMPENTKRMLEMRNYLMREIPARIPHCRLNGDPLKRLPNNLNFSFEFIEGESILLLLDALGYACSSGSACTSASLDPSHVLLAMGLPHEIAHGSLRVTLGRENSMEDVQSFADDLPAVIKRLRDLSPLWGDFVSGRITNCLIP